LLPLSLLTLTGVGTTLQPPYATSNWCLGFS